MLGFVADGAERLEQLLAVFALDFRQMAARATALEHCLAVGFGGGDAGGASFQSLSGMRILSAPTVETGGISGPPSPGWTR